MQFDHAQALFHAFDPQQPIRAATAGLYVERTESAVHSLKRALRFAGVHRFLLAGAVGSGKSTELSRIAQELHSDPQYAPLLLDLFAQFDVRDLTAGQVLFLVGVRVLGAAELDDKAASALARRLEDTYATITSEEARRGLDVAGLVSGLTRAAGTLASGALEEATVEAAGTVVTALAPLALPGRGRSLQPNDPTTQALFATVQDICLAYRAAAGRRPLVLVDGLDKVRDDPQIVELFCSGVLRCPPVSSLDLVFAAPASLRFQTGYGDTGFERLRLGLFGLLTRDGARNEGELDAMWTLVRRRVIAAGLDPSRVLPHGDARGPSIDRAIMMSGGLVRDLVQILRRAVVEASEGDGALSEAAIEAGIRSRQREYLDLVNLDVLDMLIETLESGHRPGGPLVRRLLNDNLILVYDNGAPWCRPHPMVVPTLTQRMAQTRST